MSQPSPVRETTKYCIQQYQGNLISSEKSHLTALSHSFIIKGTNFEFNLNFKVARLVPFKFKARGI